MAVSRLEQVAAALQDGQASMTSSLPACSPLHPATGVAGDMWLDLLQPWDSLEQGSAAGGWTFLLPGISLQAVLAGRAAVPGLLGLSGELEPGSGKNSRCSSAGPRAGFRQCSCARHCATVACLGTGPGEMEAFPLRSL